MKILTLILSLLLLNFLSCDDKQLTLVAGYVKDRANMPVDSVQYEVWVNGKLKKSKNYGKKTTMYKNGEKIEEVIEGFYYTDSTGKFGIPITHKNEKEIKLVFKKNGYDIKEIVLNEPIIIDTTIILDERKNKLVTVSQIDSLIKFIDTTESYGEGIAEGPMTNRDSVIGGWEEYNLFDKKTKELKRIRTYFYADTSEYYKFYYNLGDLIFAQQVEEVLGDTTKKQTLYISNDSIIFNSNPENESTKLIEYGYSKMNRK